jgi:hypothetical protein
VRQRFFGVQSVDQDKGARGRVGLVLLAHQAGAWGLRWGTFSDLLLDAKLFVPTGRIINKEPEPRLWRLRIDDGAVSWGFAPG